MEVKWMLHSLATGKAGAELQTLLPALLQLMLILICWLTLEWSNTQALVPPDTAGSSTSSKWGGLEAMSLTWVPFHPWALQPFLAGSNLYSLSPTSCLSFFSSIFFHLSSWPSWLQAAATNTDAVTVHTLFNKIPQLSIVKSLQQMQPSPSFVSCCLCV